MRSSIPILISVLTVGCRGGMQHASADRRLDVQAKPQPIITLRVPVTIKESGGTGGQDRSPYYPLDKDDDPLSSSASPAREVEPDRRTTKSTELQRAGMQQVPGGLQISTGSCPPIGKYGVIDDTASPLTPDLQCRDAWTTCCADICPGLVDDVVAVSNEQLDCGGSDETGESPGCDETFVAKLVGLEPNADPSTHACECKCQ